LAKSHPLRARGGDGSGVSGTDSNRLSSMEPIKK
jgi:hypothetical protein